MINIFYTIFGILSLIFVLILISAKNPIHRIAALISIFLTGSFIFILLDNYFLGLTYIIVYVGAIAVLFLFVIMLIEHPSVDTIPEIKNIFKNNSTVLSIKKRNNFLNSLKKEITISNVRNNNTIFIKKYSFKHLVFFYNLIDNSEINYKNNILNISKNTLKKSKIDTSKNHNDKTYVLTEYNIRWISLSLNIIILYIILSTSGFFNLEILITDTSNKIFNFEMSDAMSGLPYNSYNFYSLFSSYPLEWSYDESMEKYKAIAYNHDFLMVYLHLIKDGNLFYLSPQSMLKEAITFYNILIYPHHYIIKINPYLIFDNLNIMNINFNFIFDNLNIFNDSEIFNYFYPTWAIEFKNITDIEILGTQIYIAYPFALILVSIALWTVMIGVISICSPSR